MNWRFLVVNTTVCQRQQLSIPVEINYRRLGQLELTLLDEMNSSLFTVVEDGNLALLSSVQHLWSDSMEMVLFLQVNLAVSCWHHLHRCCVCVFVCICVCPCDTDTLSVSVHACLLLPAVSRRKPHVCSVLDCGSCCRMLSRCPLACLLPSVWVNAAVVNKTSTRGQVLASLLCVTLTATHATLYPRRTNIFLNSEQSCSWRAPSACIALCTTRIRYSGCAGGERVAFAGSPHHSSCSGATVSRGNPPEQYSCQALHPHILDSH